MQWKNMNDYGLRQQTIVPTVSAELLNPVTRSWRASRKPAASSISRKAFPGTAPSRHLAHMAPEPPAPGPGRGQDSG